jgi:myo-inositol 2-dehydrogenase / D-chiro-inositol 1-dehydrogenase
MSTPKLALWGAGMIAGAHAAAATRLGLPITAVASRTSERSATMAARLGTVAAAYDDLPGTADIVAVSTPPQLHAADTMRMLHASAAVLVEKPLCTTLADADAMVAAAAAHGNRVLYAENLAYAPVVVTLLREAAAMGPMDHMEIRTLQSLPTWGDFTSDAWGGGALFDLGVHPLAIAVLAAGANGAGPVTSVRAELRGGEGHNSDEHAEVWLTFRNGLVGHVVSSWQHDAGQVWDVQLSSPTTVLRADFWPRPVLERNGDPVAIDVADGPAPFISELGYTGQLAAFVDDIAAGRAPFMDVEFGRLILDIVCACYRSAGRGEPEAVPFRGDRGKTPLQLWHDAG